MEKYYKEIQEIRNGNKELFNVIFEDHKKMIYKIIYNHNLEIGSYMLDVDNLFQEGCLALYDSIFTYKEDRGMTFSSYAYMVIRGRIHTVIRASLKRYEEEICSIDANPNINYHRLASRSYASDDPLEYHKSIEFEKKLKEFLSSLNYTDQQIFKMRSERCTYKEISERLNTSQKNIDNRLRALRKLLKRYIKEQ